MKNSTLLLALLLLIVSGAGAQVQSGVTFGGNLSNIRGNGVSSSLNTGFMAGVFSNVTLTKKWSVKPEVLFNLTNGKKADDFMNFYNSKGNPFAGSNINLSYISVPVLFGYKASKLFTVNIGPQYNLLVYDDENLVNTTKASAFKRNDFGVAGGLQVSIDNVGFFGRYYYGLANVNNIDDRYKWHNAQLQAGVSIGIL